MVMKKIVEVKNLTKIYKKKVVVDNASFAIPKGKTVGLIGLNGAGKTTIMKVLSGLVSWDSGIVKYQGKEAIFNKDNDINIGALIENPGLYPYLTGRQNLALFSHSKKIGTVIEKMGISDFIDDKVESYSLGMKQRLGIALALINNPEFVLLDEPFSALDPKAVKYMKKTIELIEGTLLISSHLIKELEGIVDYLILMDDGKVIFEGEIANIDLRKDSLENFILKHIM